MCDFVSFWHIPKQVKGNFELGGGGGKKKKNNLKNFHELNRSTISQEKPRKK